MNRAIPLAVFAIILAEPAMAKETRFWNLTSATVNSLERAPAGATAFGPNPCANGPDGAVDHDERVRVTGATTGAYDARLTLADGRVCMAKAVRIETGKPFSLDDKDLVCAHFLCSLPPAIQAVAQFRLPERLAPRRVRGKARRQAIRSN